MRPRNDARRTKNAFAELARGEAPFPLPGNTFGFWPLLLLGLSPRYASESFSEITHLVVAEFWRHAKQMNVRPRTRLGKNPKG
jgi:hypothetical protein